MSNLEHVLWVEKYRPKTIADTILPADLKKIFQNFVDTNTIPNLLLTGKPGVGKTTVAKAMLEEIGADYIVINGSMNGNIDTLRNEIKDFASSMSFGGGRKVVIIDEADYLNMQSTQPALRNFMEEYSSNCGFILTCNLKNRIMEPLQSRCSVIDFKISNTDKSKLALEFMKRLMTILEKEGVEYDKKVLVELITMHFPDWRRVLNESQRYAATGKIDSGILRNFSDDSYKTLIEHLKKKNFTEMRKWVHENSDIDPLVVMRTLYDTAHNYMLPSAIPSLVLNIADYQYKHAFVSDHEINLVAFLTTVMIDAEWKSV